MGDERNIDMSLGGLDERFMREALVEAHAAAAEGEVPIGAVVVYEGEPSPGRTTVVSWTKTPLRMLSSRRWSRQPARSDAGGSRAARCM